MLLKGIIRLLFVFTLLFSVNGLQAQWRLILEVVVTDEGKRMSGAEIKVYKGGTLVETVLTNSKGEADIPMNPNGDYSIEIGGNKGVIKKKLSVNTNNVPAGAAKGDQYFPAEVDLFKKVEGLDYEILEKPIGKILYDPDVGFDVDVAYTKHQKSALDKLQKEFLAQKAKEAADGKEKKKQYDAAVKIADKAFADEKWETAEEYYKKANAILPEELHPSFQLAELNSKLIEIRELNKKYDAAIAKADAAVAAGNLEASMADYQKASGLKPNEAYPKDKLTEIKSKLADQAKSEQGYLAAIEKGDNALQSNDLETARTAFEEASSLKPSESYPKNKLSEIKDILAKLKAKEEEYTIAVKLADDALASKDYKTAKSQYQKALGIKPTESYPKDQIQKVDGLLAESAKLDQNYLAAIEKGDNALAANNYDEAKIAFLEASKIKTQEEYPKNKIKEIDDFIAKNNEKNKAYESAIAAADKLLDAEKYEEAKSKYEEASSVKPSESYPKGQIAGIKTKLADLAAEQAEIRLQNEKEAKIQAEFDGHMAAAQGALEKSVYDLAKEEYEKALLIKTEDEYALSQLKKVKDIIAQQLAQKLAREKLLADYLAAIKSGDDALASENFTEAQKFYKEALALKAEEKYPKSKLEEIEKTLAERAKSEENYLTAIKNGDKAFGAESWEEAKKAYNEALTIKKDDYPTQKIKEIEDKLSALAAEKQAAAKLEADYQAFIAEGDKKLAEKAYEEALSSFENAVNLKAAEKYPADKIAEIKIELNRLLKQKEEAEKLAAIQKEYDNLITKADGDFSNDKLDDARKSYQAALALKSDESYPQTKIDEINEVLADAAEQDKTYQAAISAGDKLFQDNKYEDAKSKYAEASSIKSAESYPKEQIKAIEDKLVELAAQAEDIRLQKEKDAKLEQRYQNQIAKADELFKNEEYANAKSSYKEALSIKDEEYPKDKINQIEALIAQLADKEAAEKVAAEQAKIDAQYQALISEADALFESNELEKAKSKYSEALGVKEDNYPAQQIEKIDSQLSTLANKEAEQARLAKLETEYLAVIEKGDNALSANNLDLALNAFTEANQLKPNEVYPVNKIQEINDIKAKKLAAEKEGLKVAMDRQYIDAIDVADAAFESANYTEAKNQYMKASALKPSEAYPKNQVSKIEELISNASAEKEKIRLQQEREARNEASYQTAIAAADKFYTDTKWNEAENEYRLALSLKPSEVYPQEQLNKINEQRSKLDANKAALAEKEAQFNSLMESAQKAFEKNSYNLAHRDYTAALQIKPSDSYAQGQLKKINDIIARQKELLAQKEEPKKEEKPITIKKGPKSTVSGDAEAEIERLYKEMWAKKNSEKNDLLKDKQELIKKYNQEKQERDSEDRKNAIEKIEEISISMREQNELTSDLYLQNYETVKQKTKDVTEADIDLSREAERNRNNSFEDISTGSNESDNFYKDRSLTMLEGKKEMVENEHEELRTTFIRLEKVQEETREKNRDEFVEIAEEIGEYNKELALSNLTKNTDEIQEIQEGLKTEGDRYTNESYKRISDNQQDINDKQVELSQFFVSKDGAYMENQQEIEEKVKVLKEEGESLGAESEKKRQENLEEEYYQGEDLPRQDPEASDYNQGVTEEIIENDNNSTTIRRVVVNGTEVDIYEKTFFAYGEVFYTKNGNNITQETWDAESR